MIYLYTGKPRQGKTHELVRDCAAQLRREKDLWMWVNRPLGQTLRLPESSMARVHIFDRLEELNDLIEWMDKKEIKNCIIAIDEAQAYVNARKWDLLSEEIQYLMQTHGHYGIDFRITSQHESRIDIVFRQLVQELVCFKCIKFFGWILFIGTKFETDLMDKEEKKVVGHRWWIRSPWDIIQYDTHAKIEFPKRKNLVEHKFLRCEACGTEKRCG